jgi:hypothetical protein
MQRNAFLFRFLFPNICFVFSCAECRFTFLGHYFSSNGSFDLTTDYTTLYASTAPGAVDYHVPHEDDPGRLDVH